MMNNRRNKVARVARPKAFYIAVNPVGSKFAKALQQDIKEKVDNNVYRVKPERAAAKEARGAAVFRITPGVLTKIQQFQAFTRDGVNCPKWTTDASRLAELESEVIFARTLVNSTGGRGIVEFTLGSDPTPRAPLYTAYVKKKAEYRVHVFNGEAIDIQQKKKKREFNADTRDTRVRNLANGYVYCRDGLVPPEGIQDLAIRAVAAVGYRYGAVDIIYNERNNQCYVLEVNSRPGLMGTTLERYSNAIITASNLRRNNGS